MLPEIKQWKCRLSIGADEEDGDDLTESTGASPDDERLFENMLHSEETQQAKPVLTADFKHCYRKSARDEEAALKVAQHSF